jgi:hypothetical protein
LLHRCESALGVLGLGDAIDDVDPVMALTIREHASEGGLDHLLRCALVI